MPNSMNHSPDMAFVLSRVSARFSDEKGRSAPVLQDVDLAVPRGSFTTLLGPSGSGKSTLMRIILNLVPHTSGTVVRNFIRPAMAFQNYALFPWLSALDNVAFGLRMNGARGEEAKVAALEKLKEVGLEQVAGHYPSMLSGGQKQRVGLARALAISPDLLIMDEPFSNLDTITAETLKADLLRIWRTYGMTILMINHLLPDAVELSDHIVIMGAHPGHIEKTLTVPLTRPRNTRDPQFYKEVDSLIAAIRAIS